MNDIQSKMKAAYLPGNSTVELKTMEVPEPGQGQVLIKTKSSTICGSDIRAIYHKHLGKGPEVRREWSYEGLEPEIEDVDLDAMAVTIAIETH